MRMFPISATAPTPPPPVLRHHPRISVDQVSCGAYPAPATAVPRLVWLRAAPAGQPRCAVGAASAVGTAWPLAGAAGGAPEAAARKVAVSFQIFRPLTAGRGSTGIDTPHAAGATASAHVCISTHKGVFALPGLRSGGFCAVSMQPAVHQRDGLIDHVGPYALLRRDGLHQPVHPLDMGRAGRQGPRRRGRGGQ